MADSERSVNIRPGIYLQSPEVQANPYPAYAFLREYYPVCKVEPDGLWAISRFEDVQRVLACSEVFSAAASSELYDFSWDKDHCRMSRPLISQDPPEHKKYSSLVNKAFLDNATKPLIPLMRETATALLTRFNQQEPVDFTEQFAYPYVGKIIQTIVGLDQTQSLDEIRQWIECEEQITPVRPDDAFISTFNSVISRQNSYFMDVINDRRSHPQKDLVTHLVNAKIDQRKLTDQELCGFLCVLVSAGFLTTIQMLNLAIIFLARQPRILAVLVTSPRLIPAFIEELLRFSPAVLSTVRVTTQTVVLSGISIPEGDVVMPLLASANRDASVFPHPDIFDLHRVPNKQHVSFGHGVHTCIGSALARLELKIALETLLASCTHISCPENNHLAWVNTVFVRGVSELPACFH